MINNTNEINKLITSRMQGIKSNIANMPGLIQTNITENAKFISFKDELGNIKAAVGFINDENGNGIPGLRLGAGNGSGGDFGYITKGIGGLSQYYIGNDPTHVTYIKLAEDGIYYGATGATDKKVFILDEGNKLADGYIAQATNWNAKIAEADLQNSSKNLKIHTNNIAAGARWDGKTTLIGADGIYVGDLTANQIKTGLLNAGQVAIQTAATGNRLLLDNTGLNSYIGTTKHGWQMSTTGNFGMLDGYANGTQYAQLQVNQTFTALSATKGILQLVSENSNVEIKSGSAYGGTGKVNFTGNVDFTNANCTGFTVCWG